MNKGYMTELRVELDRRSARITELEAALDKYQQDDERYLGRIAELQAIVSLHQVIEHDLKAKLGRVRGLPTYQIDFPKQIAGVWVKLADVQSALGDEDE